MAQTALSKKDKIFHPDCEFYSRVAHPLVEEDLTVEEILAEECSDPRVSVVSMTSEGRRTYIYFKKRVQKPRHTHMTIHNIIDRLKEVGRDELAEVLRPPSHSGHLRTDHEIAVMLAMVHDRALGKEVDFHDLKGVREYGQP